MKKILTIFLGFIVICTLAGAYIYYDSYYISPTNFQITYIEKEGIDGFEDINLVFFSDLQYGDYFNQDELTKLQESISLIDSNIVVFGGDLFSEDYNIISNDINVIVDFLKSIDAPLGKFYILGDYDCTSQTREVLVKKILEDAGFQLIEDYLPIYNGTINHHINFYGYSYNQDYKENVADTSYGICFIHDEEIIEQAKDCYNYVLIGNAHDYQVNNPFNKGKYALGENQNLYRVSSIGMSQKPYRLFNDPEIAVVTFR